MYARTEKVVVKSLASRCRPQHEMCHCPSNSCRCMLAVLVTIVCHTSVLITTLRITLVTKTIVTYIGKTISNKCQIGKQLRIWFTEEKRKLSLLDSSGVWLMVHCYKCGKDKMPNTHVYQLRHPLHLNTTLRL